MLKFNVCYRAEKATSCISNASFMCHVSLQGDRTEFNTKPEFAIINTLINFTKFQGKGIPNHFIDSV